MLIFLLFKDYTGLYSIGFPIYKSRMLLSMLHGPGRILSDTGIWDLDFGDICRKHYEWGPGRVFKETGIYSIYLKDYGIFLKRLHGIVGIKRYKDSWILGILIRNSI